MKEWKQLLIIGNAVGIGIGIVIASTLDIFGKMQEAIVPTYNIICILSFAAIACKWKKRK
jgi:hypothetical protein